MAKRGSQLLTFIITFAIWLGLTWQLSYLNFLFGIFFALLATLLFGEVLTVHPHRFLHPLRYLWFLYYLPVFLWEMIKANLDVAYRVLHPALPIDPGLIMVKTALTNEVALALLGNSLTLTPGNTTVDIKNGFIFVHCIDVNRHVLQTAGKFESIIARIFE
jgi:multicomponent Na+:H+ antiporter subunit E